MTGLRSAEPAVPGSGGAEPAVPGSGGADAPTDGVAPDEQDPPRSGGVLLLSAGLVVLALALLLGGAPLLESDLAGGWRVWLGLAVVFAVAERLVVHLHVGPQALTYSFGEVPLIVGLAFVDPRAVIAAQLLGGGVAYAVRYRCSLKAAFNVAHVSLEAVLAALTWHLVLSGGDPAGPRGWLAALAVLVVTDLYSAAAVGAVMRLARAPRGPRGTVVDFLSGSGVAVVNVSLGVLMIVLIDADWRAAWALAVLPLAVSLGYRSHVELRRRHQSLEKLVGFTEDVNLDMGTDVVGSVVLTRAAQLVDADVVELTWRRSGVPELQVAQRGRRATVPVPPLAARFGALGARPVVARRSPRDAVLRAQLEAADLRDAIVVPLLVEGDVRGSLLVGDRLGDVATFTDDDVRVLQALGNHAAVALANAQLADELRHEAAKRRHEAQHDALTGLGNRQLFLSAVRARTVEDEPLAVLLLDLDRFKDVNDTLGHTIGDLLLGKVAERLLSAVPADAMIARLGGDEFGVLLVGVGEVDAAATAHRLRAALSRPHQVGELSLHTSCSIGIAISPKDGHDPEVLLQRADIAMYAAKADHAGFHVYSPEGDHYSARRLALVGDLRSALANGGLHVHYQPTVDLTTGEMVGVEALVRWNHDEYGAIAPDEFLPIAEHTDLMLPLTTFVLGTALRDTAAWEAQGLRLDVSVNLSPRVLVEREIPRLVADLLLATGVPAQRLTAEITEHSIISDPARATAVLEELDGMGVGLSVDDFGTGYGSLSYLRRLPVHEVKIDKSFVLEVATADSDAAIVRSTIELGHRLGLRVVAEGVETAEMWAALSDMHCDVAQGYLMSRPLPALAIPAWSQDWRAGAAARADDAGLRAGAASAPREGLLRAVP